MAKAYLKLLVTAGIAGLIILHPSPFDKLLNGVVSAFTNVTKIV